MSESARGLGKLVYIRPFGEMNGHWNAYCAYNTNGTPRGAAYSTASFRKAFARIYLIMHGGPTVNATLKRLGMPPVSTEVPTNPFVKVVWNPQGYGSPDVPGNSAQAYYPGDRYVDVVGDDLYDIGGKAEFAAADALYKAHPSKPFSFPEWGLWGIDDPGFVQQMAKFVSTHPRTKLIAYFNAKPGSIFDLQSKPKSLAAYKKYIVPLGRCASAERDEAPTGCRDRARSRRQRACRGRARTSRAAGRAFRGRSCRAAPAGPSERARSSPASRAPRSPCSCLFACAERPPERRAKNPRGAWVV
jgi:hypothetical protein